MTEWERHGTDPTLKGPNGEIIRVGNGGLTLSKKNDRLCNRILKFLNKNQKEEKEVQEFNELKKQMAITYGKFGKEKALISGDKAFTGNEIKNEIKEGTELGNYLVSLMVNLSIDLVKRQKEKLNEEF